MRRKFPETSSGTTAKSVQKNTLVFVTTLMILLILQMVMMVGEVTYHDPFPGLVTAGRP